MGSLMDFYTGFEWRNAPLHHPKYPIATAIIYVVCAVVYKLRSKPGSSKEKPTRDLRNVQIFHNLVLSGGSLLMLLGAIFDIWRRAGAHGYSFLLCEDPLMTSSGPLYFWSYLYYLSKYYELLDTVITLVRGRPPPHFVLHVYHHACVLIMTWSWMEYSTTLQFLGMMFNTSVHVVMYYYYYVRLVRGPPKWKSFVTIFQIVQFMTSVGLFCVTGYKIMLEGQQCQGVSSLLWTMVFNVTLLYEFVMVYISNNKKKSKKQ
mmetsp:Transcript_23992/g.31367  ORF Transcript_23992/g.31367 Transcript_23992/m.31367 type:complete len:260 (+) Transcript_23992:96-875(+)